MKLDLKNYDYEVEIDLDFWKDLKIPNDIEEAYEEYVRSCIDFSESTNWFNDSNDSNIYIVWLDWYFFIW